jgi:hypothetical protein
VMCCPGEALDNTSHNHHERPWVASLRSKRRLGLVVAIF